MVDNGEDGEPLLTIITNRRMTVLVQRQRQEDRARYRSRVEFNGNAGERGGWNDGVEEAPSGLDVRPVVELEEIISEQHFHC